MMTKMTMARLQSAFSFALFIPLIVGGRKVPPVAPEASIIAVTIPLLVREMLGSQELPVSIRNANYYSATWWNCVASYSTKYRDTLTRERPVISNPNDASHTSKNRAACVVQATASLNDLLFGGIPAFLIAMENLPVVATLPLTTIDAKVDGDVLACGKDELCLEEIAALAGYEPQTVGHIIALQSYLYALEDGFNQLGKDDGCVVNCRAFSDSVGYSPVGSEWSKYCDRWVPLTEDDGRGFFFDQQHVTPHIGEKAKFRFLPETDRYTRVVRKPNYSKSRRKEADEVISTMALLDDTKKIQVEAFDDKFYVNAQVIAAYIAKLVGLEYEEPEFGTEYYVTMERLIHFATGITGMENDSIIIAWKEKIATDLIRPTSVIKRRGDEKITTWAPGGVQTFPAKDFEAYIRVMPHSEYVSGSSCLFTAFADYVVNYLEGIGVDPVLPINFPAVEVGASKVEPGIVPSSPIALQYPSIEAMAEASGQSRIDGGMHFVDAIPAGAELCTGIGKIAADRNLALLVSQDDVDDEEKPSMSVTDKSSSESSSVKKGMKMMMMSKRMRA